MGASSDVNHADQPTVCCVCGLPVRKTVDSAMFYYDDTKAKAHWTRHSACRAV